MADPSLPGGQEVVNYTVVTGDSLTSIATNMAVAITSDANLKALGVNAAATSGLLKIRSVSPNVTTYSQSTSGGATETIALGVSTNAVQNATIGVIGNSYQTRLNDVLSIKVYDAALTGGTETVAYTVPADNTALTTVATGLASAVNADTHLSTIGVTATAAGAVVSLKSSSTNLTTYSSSVTPAPASATETLTFGTNTVGNTTATVGGTITVGDVVGITFRAGSLATGTESISYKVPTGATTTSIATGLKTAITADTKLSTYGLTATSSGAVVTISSTPTYTKSTSGGATETVTLGTNVNGNTTATIGGTVTAGNTVTVTVSGAGLAAARPETYTVLAGDTLTTIASGLAGKFNADASLKAIGVTATSAGAVVNIAYNPVNYAKFQGFVTGGATETIALSLNNNSPQSASVSGTVTTGDTVSLTALDLGLTGGLETVSYTVLAGDTPTSIATGLTTAINGDTKLQAIGVSATSSGAAITLVSLSSNFTTYNPSTSTTATESFAVGSNPNGTQTLALSGTKTTGDVVSLTAYDAGLTGGKETVSYTVLAADTLTSIAAGLTAAINADAQLIAINATATSSSTVLFIKSASTNLTTFAQSTNVGATETLTLSTSAGVTQAGYNGLNELISINGGGAVAVQGSTNKPVKSVTFPAVNISSVQGPTYAASNNVYYFLNNYYTVCQNLTTTVSLSGGGSCCTHWLYVTSNLLPGGQVTITVSGASTTDVITKLT